MLNFIDFQNGDRAKAGLYQNAQSASYLPLTLTQNNGDSFFKFFWIMWISQVSIFLRKMNFSLYANILIFLKLGQVLNERPGNCIFCWSIQEFQC